MDAQRTWLVVGLCALAVVACGAALGQRLRSASAEGALEISAGGFHTCAVTSTGGVKCWGRNDFGQLGDGTTTNSATPVDAVGLASAAIAVSAGGSHTCVLTSTGGVKCWGRNDFGQLGDGTTTDSAMPVDVSGLDSGVAVVSSGGFHTCAVTTAGTVKCWGRNDRGQLGDGTTTNRTNPVDVSGFAGGAAAVSAGGSDSAGGHTCGVTIPGGAECWGRNDFGQLGDGTMASHLSPAPVSGMVSGVSDVRAGRYHSCGLMTSGGVRCWGWNISGQVGDGTNYTRTTPVDVVGLIDGVKALTVGGIHSCALTTSAGVKCWGSNNTGQIGDGSSGNNRMTPVDVLEAAGGQPLTDVASVAAGGNITTSGFTCVLTDVGGAKCWGSNAFGQLGDGTTTDRPSPVDVVGLAPKPTATDTPTSTATPTPTATATFTQTPTPTGTQVPSTLEELLDELEEVVSGFDVPRGVRNSLVAKLDVTLRLVQRDRPCAAVNPMNAFINEGEALLRSRRISSDEAADLIARAEEIVGRLLAQGNCSR